MTREEHTEIINSIRNSQSDVERNNFLLQLSSDYEAMLSKSTAQNERITTLEKENVEYAKLNNQLFLQIGASDKNINEPTSNEPTSNEPPKKLSFDALTFDN